MISPFKEVGYYTLRLLVNDVDIYTHYFGYFETGRKYPSPFRSEGVGSFCFMLRKDGAITWKDFGLFKSAPNDGIGFVQELYDLKRQDAIQKIWEDLVLGWGDNTQIVRKPLLSNKRVPYVQESGRLHEWELKYWKRLMFDRQLLDFFDVKGLRGLYREERSLWWSSRTNPTYVYLLEDGAFKAYRPLDPTGDKFRGCKNGSLIEGWKQLPKRGSHLFLQSSLKDTMTFRKMGCLGCNSSSENSYHVLLSKMKEINERFDDVYIMYDNDNAGIRAAKRLEAMSTWKWKPVFMPKHMSKDPSDLVMRIGNYAPLLDMVRDLGITNRYYAR